MPTRTQRLDSSATKSFTHQDLRFGAETLRLTGDVIGMGWRSFLALFSCAALIMAAHWSTQAADRSDLQPPAAFAGIADPAARSSALFTEAAKVLTHPRCMNCHPAGDRPLQGNDQRP